MMKARVLSIVCGVIGLVASSAMVAHAGGGGVGSSIPQAFGLADCYVIDGGANSPFVVTLTDENGIHQHVRLGKPRLLCTFTTGDTTVDHGPVLNPLFDIGTVSHTECYDVTTPGDSSGEALVTVTDPFVSQQVERNRMRMVCVPASVGP